MLQEDVTLHRYFAGNSPSFGRASNHEIRPTDSLLHYMLQQSYELHVTPTLNIKRSLADLLSCHRWAGAAAGWPAAASGGRWPHPGLPTPTVGLTVAAGTSAAAQQFCIKLLQHTTIRVPTVTTKDSVLTKTKGSISISTKTKGSISISTKTKWHSPFLPNLIYINCLKSAEKKRDHNF